MTASLKGGFGVQSGLITVSSNVAGVNTVTKNVGSAISVQAGRFPVRLSLLRWRIDLAPDVPAGTVSAPVLWRIVVFQAAQFPNDISALQVQAYPGGSHPEIPFANGVSSPLPILADIWLDATQGDPGFSELAQQEWVDAGPSCDGGSALCILVTPITDANMDQSQLGTCNANVYLEAYGREDATGRTGGYSQASSLPRYDVEAPS